MGKRTSRSHQFARRKKAKNNFNYYSKDATLRELASVSDGVAAINLPKKILFIDAIPVMATGKTNYAALTTWCLNQL